MEEEETDEKPHWMELFERQSHRRYMEHLRDKEYEDIINTLRQGFDEEEKLGSPVHLPLPPEQYFLTPDFPMHYDLHHSSLASGSGSMSTSDTVTSSEGSTVMTSIPTSTKYLPPEVVEERKRSRRKCTGAVICVGVLAIAFMALTVGVVLHFLLETGSLGGQGAPPAMLTHARGHHLPGAPQ